MTQIVKNCSDFPCAIVVFDPLLNDLDPHHFEIGPLDPMDTQPDHEKPDNSANDVEMMVVSFRRNIALDYEVGNNWEVHWIEEEEDLDDFEEEYEENYEGDVGNYLQEDIGPWLVEEKEEDGQNGNEEEEDIDLNFGFDGYDTD